MHGHIVYYCVFVTSAGKYGFCGLPLTSPALKGSEREMLGIDSPVPPVLQTPGVRQIKKPCANYEDSLKPKPVFNLNGEEMDSPIIPVFQTPGVPQIKKVTNADRNPEISINLTGKPVFTLDTDPDMATPEMPQLTSNFKVRFLFICVC